MSFFIDSMLDVSVKGNEIFGSSVVVTWSITSDFSSNGIILVVTEKPNSVFVTQPIGDDLSRQCINNLKPNTQYSITAHATFNCYNLTKSVDFVTRSTDSANGGSTQDCIKFDSEKRIGNDSSTCTYM